MLVESVDDYKYPLTRPKKARIHVTNFNLDEPSYASDEDFRSIFKYTYHGDIIINSANHMEGVYIVNKPKIFSRRKPTVLDFLPRDLAEIIGDYQAAPNRFQLLNKYLPQALVEAIVEPYVNQRIFYIDEDHNIPSEFSIGKLPIRYYVNINHVIDHTNDPRAAKTLAKTYISRLFSRRNSLARELDKSFYRNITKMKYVRVRPDGSGENFLKIKYKGKYFKIYIDQDRLANMCTQILKLNKHANMQTKALRYLEIFGSDDFDSTRVLFVACIGYNFHVL